MKYGYAAVVPIYQTYEMQLLNIWKLQFILLGRSSAELITADSKKEIQYYRQLEF